MKLSKDTIKLLKWLKKNDIWKYYREIEKGYKQFDYRSFNTLKSAGYVDSCVFEDEVPDYDEYGRMYLPEHYRISDSGKAYLDGRFFTWLPELRGWVAILISVLALLVSIMSLILR